MEVSGMLVGRVELSSYYEIVRRAECVVIVVIWKFKDGDV